MSDEMPYLGYWQWWTFRCISMSAIYVQQFFKSDYVRHLMDLNLLQLQAMPGETSSIFADT